MIRIVADTTSCLSVEEAHQLGVPYVPQIIVFGEETFRDDTEMDSKEFLRRLRASSSLPKTSAPPPEMYAPIFKEFSERSETIIVLCPSADLSGTFRSASVAAKDFPDADIHLVDTRLVAGGFGAVVREAVCWANDGMNPQMLIENVQEMAKRHRIFFVVDTLEYLYKGGRIGAAKALFGSLLQVKPILSLEDGRIVPCESQRTHRRAFARLHEILLTDCPRDPSSHLNIMHGDAELEANQLASDLCQELGIPKSDIPIYDAPPAILVHAGPGVIAGSYFVRPGQI